jgi:hypothetical protein
MIQSVVRTNPKTPAYIFIEFSNRVVTQAGWNTGVVFVDLEMLTIEAVKTVLSANPDESILVLQNARSCALRQPLINRDLFEWEGKLGAS